MTGAAIRLLEVSFLENKFSLQFDLLCRLTHQNVKFSRINMPLFEVNVVVRERATVKLYRNMPAFARTQVDFRKAFQFLGGTRNFCMLVANIDLCDLIALTLPRVGDFERHSNIASSALHREIAIIKRGV